MCVPKGRQEAATPGEDDRNNGAIAINYTQSANYVVPNNLTLSN